MSKVLQRGAREDNEASVFILTLRDYARYHKNSYYYTCGKMVNSGGGGLCFESDYAIQPESDICIKMTDKLHSGSKNFETEYQLHNGKVKWCRQMKRAGNPCYGVGVEIIEKNVRAK